MIKHKELAKLLLSLEEILRIAKLWQETPIKKQLLNSQQPFCHDTLKPEQWLQFIFIAKLEQLNKAHLPLPSSCNISPYYEEALKEHPQVKEICELTKKIDNLLSN